MITMGAVYWITRLDSICNLVSVGALLLLIALIGVVMTYPIWSDEVEEENKIKLWKSVKVSFIIFCFLAAITAFLPTTKEAVAIYMIPKIANNEQVQKLPDNAMKFLNGKFEEWIKDMEKKGESK